MDNLTGWHLLLLLPMIALVVVWAVALVQIGRSGLDATAKALWALIVIVAPFLGVIAWWLIGKPSDRSAKGISGPRL
ncbi:hypothetical protein ASF62_03445 [Leifsonia sp. Leaf325]|nr:PLD nuclease N-terminal domain-containing protein [Leifsonia sp. Leaf325]KQQ95580.1 hypothetical protein ASF62_03445 [Leifsonia sp. Leaf325]